MRLTATVFVAKYAEEYQLLKPHPRQRRRAATGIAAVVFGKPRVIESRRRLDRSNGADLDDVGSNHNLNLQYAA